MQKAKSILSMTLVLVMILALAACGGTTESSAPESTAPNPPRLRAKLPRPPAGSPLSRLR